MSRPHNSHLMISCIILWSMAIFRLSGGGSITWFEPPPFETVTDPSSTPAANINLTKGSSNEELSCNFSLSADLSLVTASIKLGSSSVASFVHAQQRLSVQTGFEDRFNATWVPYELTVILLNVTSAEEGEYRCEVLTVGGSVQTWMRKIRVSLLVLASITEISGKTVIEGENLALKCLVEGEPKPSFTWTRLSDNRIVTMPLNNFSRHDVRDYKCTADNGVGNPATRNVTVDVQFAPEIASLSTNLSTVPVVCAGMFVNFTCTVEAANPAVDIFTLYQNGSVISKKTHSGIWIETLDAVGEVTYQCQANNSVGTSSSKKTRFFVEVPASVDIENDTIVVLEGRKVTLDCLASGFPSPNVSWIDLSKEVVGEGRNLKFLNIRRNNTGSYTCTVSNSCGNDRKKVDIVVEYPPEVNGSGQNATVAGGVEHTFSCPVDGNPVPNITWYSETGAYRGKQFKTRESGCYICVARNIHGISDNITQCLIINSSLPTVLPTTVDSSQIMVSSTTVSRNPSRIMVSSAKASQSPSSSSTTAPKATPHLIIIIAVVGGVVFLAILVGVLTWWVHKQRKCRKDPKIHNSDLGRDYDEGRHSQVQGAYAQSGPPAANGTDGAAEQEIGVAGAIPTYTVVDKSKKSKKQADEKPPEYAVVDKSQKKEKQEVAAVPTYAAVDKSKKKKKSRQEVPAVYAEVDKSKKKKKKIDDKNLYENLDEPKKEKKPGELLYADLGDFQNPSMPAVSISPQPLPAIKKADPYERTDYADITQFLKGNATLPPNDGNGDTEMKPKRPSKKEIQGNDKETPI